MNKCENCNIEFDGDTCPVCGKEADKKFDFHQLFTVLGIMAVIFILLLILCFFI